MTQIASSDVLAMALRYTSALYELRTGGENLPANLEVVEIAILFVKLGNENIFKNKFDVQLRGADNALIGARARVRRGASAFSPAEDALLVNLLKIYSDMLRTVSFKQFCLILSKMEDVKGIHEIET